MEQHPRYTFGKNEKLKKRKQIDALFASGRSFTHFPVKIIYSISEPAENAAQPKPVLAGVSVSKRYFKKAVHRNRIKRLLRESYRRNKHLLDGLQIPADKQLLLFFIYLDKTLPNFAPLEQQMIWGLNRLVKALKEKL